MRSLCSVLVLFSLALLIACSTLPALAQSDDPVWTEGPATVDLGDNLAQVALREGYLFDGAEDTE